MQVLLCFPKQKKELWWMAKISILKRHSSIHFANI